MNYLYQISFFHISSINYHCIYNYINLLMQIDGLLRPAKTVVIGSNPIKLFSKNSCSSVEERLMLPVTLFSVVFII